MKDDIITLVIILFLGTLLAITYFTGDTNETLIRENERCLYENAKLEDANTRLLEELSETVEDWEEK